MPLSQGLDVGLIEWTERLAQGLKDPQLSTNSSPSHRFTTQTRSQAYKGNVGATEGRDGPEGGRPASPRPAGLARATVEATQLSPTPGEDLKHPGEGGGHVATPLGRPA